MPIDLEEYQRLKAAADEARRQSDQAVGALAQLKRRLRDEHGCKTVADAEVLLAKLEKEVKAAERDYERELAAFKKKWPKLLEDGK